MGFSLIDYGGQKPGLKKARKAPQFSKNKVNQNSKGVVSYVYAVLNSKEYLEKYASDLKKTFPRIPLLRHKEKYVEIGRKLAELHLDYENQSCWNGVEVVISNSNPNYRVTKMKHPNKGVLDTIIYNEHITISNIPEKTYEYVVNGKPAIEWIINQYQVKTDKKSGIVDDSNFKNIDELIQLQQSKVNKVKYLKSAYLSEMFPKEGEKYPKKRFEGFTKAWEFKNLETLTTTFTDGDWIESKDQSESGVRLIQTGNIGVTQFLDKPNNKKWISESTFKKLNCEEIFPGDILISRLPEPAGRATIVPKLNICMITAVDCTIVRPSLEYSSDFLIQYLSTSNYFNKITAELASGTRQRISRSNLAEIKVPVPKTLKEQEKIGRFFKKLDNQIAIEEEKLTKLEKLKQAYLNDMFV